MKIEVTTHELWKAILTCTYCMENSNVEKGHKNCASIQILMQRVIVQPYRIMEYL